MQSKQQARIRVERRLVAVSDKEFAQASEAVRSYIKTFLEGQEVRLLLLYTASPRWREIDIAWIEKDDKFLCDYVAFSKKALFPAKSYDVIFIPLFGFNDEGYRLGHGSGWYDQFLTSQPQAIKIGIGLEVGRIEFRADPHDIPIDVIITENRMVTSGAL